MTIKSVLKSVHIDSDSAAKCFADALEKAWKKSEMTCQSQSQYVPGFIIGCEKLPLYEIPDDSGDAIGVVSNLTEVMIDLSSYCDGFYKICTASGMEGYCEKFHISIRGD